MKKATVASTAVWTVAAFLLIGEQVASQRWPFVAHPPFANAITFAGIGIVAASMALMKDVSRQEVLLSSLNSPRRNILNAINFVAAISAALSLAFLAGLFGPMSLHSQLFPSLAVILLVGIAVQTGFALITNSNSNRQNGLTKN